MGNSPKGVMLECWGGWMGWDGMGGFQSPALAIKLQPVTATAWAGHMGRRIESSGRGGRWGSQGDIRSLKPSRQRAWLPELGSATPRLEPQQPFANHRI